MKLFTSYLSVGLIVTAISALLFTKLNWLAFSFLGLTCGLTTQSFRRCLMGFFTSAGLGLTFIIFVPVYSSPPEPPGLLHFGETYIAGIFGASIGAALQLPQRQMIVAAIVGCGFSLITLVFLSAVLRAAFAEQLKVLEMWEYATIIFAVPVLGIGTWWPVDRIVSGHQSAESSFLKRHQRSE